MLTEPFWTRHHDRADQRYQVRRSILRMGGFGSAEETLHARRARRAAIVGGVSLGLALVGTGMGIALGPVSDHVSYLHQLGHDNLIKLDEGIFGFSLFSALVAGGAYTYRAHAQRNLLSTAFKNVPGGTR